MPAPHRTSETGLSAAALHQLERALRQRRDRDLAESAALAESMVDVLAARSDAPSDDEHDPEGPTLTFEWSRLRAVQQDAADDLRAVDAALARIATGTFGSCARCGSPIGAERLTARPTAELCIDCARIQTA